MRVRMVVGFMFFFLFRLGGFGLFGGLVSVVVAMCG